MARIRPVHEIGALSPRETLILGLWDQGKTIRQIARQTGHDYNDVSNLISKLDGGGEFHAHRIEMRRGSAALLQAMRAAA